VEADKPKIDNQVKKAEIHKEIKKLSESIFANSKK